MMEAEAPQCAAGHTMAASSFRGEGYAHGYDCDDCGGMFVAPSASAVAVAHQQLALSDGVPVLTCPARWFCGPCRADVCFECCPGPPEDDEATDAASGLVGDGTAGAGAAAAAGAVDGARASATSEEKPAWMLEMEAMGEETGLACTVCQEGYAFRPHEPLAAYVFAKCVRGTRPRRAEGPFSQGGRPAARQAADRPLATLVSSFNVIHLSCHAAAAQADKALKVLTTRTFV
jgi:hypothetical protein